MSSPMLANLLKLVGSPRDGALLRLSLGNEYLKDGDTAAAIEHYRAATVFDAKYSAAWKMLGKALLEAGRTAEAAEAWQRGIAVAGERGDRQAVREMTVFLRRLDRAPG